MQPVSHMDTRAPAACGSAPSGLSIASAATLVRCRYSTSPAGAPHAGEEAGVRGKIREALERFKPALIDLILVQLGWPAIGLKTGLKDLIVCCFALCFAQWGLLGN
ncbi:MAG TPA: hypothetical protein VN685_03795 [Rhizomicrobium sp.]|nr:hypothetical protein [Rhizomicrobium sp.]